MVPAFVYGDGDEELDIPYRIRFLLLSAPHLLRVGPEFIVISAITSETPPLKIIKLVCIWIVGTSMEGASHKFLGAVLSLYLHTYKKCLQAYQLGFDS
jgi:hypothetical protein